MGQAIITTPSPGGEREVHHSQHLYSLACAQNDPQPKKNKKNYFFLQLNNHQGDQFSQKNQKETKSMITFLTTKKPFLVTQTDPSIHGEWTCLKSIAGFAVERVPFAGSFCKQSHANHTYMSGFSF
jgi:hypothetical protein